MDKPISLYRTTWFSKFFECIYACVAFATTTSIILEPLLRRYAESFSEESSANIFLLFYAGAMVASVVYSLWWHHKERTGDFNSDIKHAWLRGIIRYFITFEVSVYGFAKILKTQFVLPVSLTDTPVSSLNGFYLTWNYFGYSHTFAVILGLFQIGGGILLLFRRTSLLGVFVLLPVMVNIVLINIFYHIAQGAFINSLIITFALIYLLFLRWTDLKAIFFRNDAELPKIKLVVLKSIAKVVTIGAAFGIIYSYVATLTQPYFAGKWSVNEITRNSRPVNPGEWQTNAMIWANIYFEQPGKVILSYNPYIYESARANTANFSYDAKNHRLVLSYAGFSERSDTGVVTISHYDGKSMQWKLVHNSDTLRYSLVKAGTAR